MRSKKNRQIMLDIPRDWALLHHLEEEAARHGIRVPLYIRILLKDRDDALYGNEGDQDIWFPRDLLTPTQELPVVKPVSQEVQTYQEDAHKRALALQQFGGEDE